VAAIIIEPITAFENQMATPYFYKRLRTIASDYKIPFVVDETKTGAGSTGKMWAHEHWYLSEPADLVTFGGRAGISGFYSSIEYRLSDDHDGVSFDQSVDMVKLVNFGLTWKFVQKKNILNYVQDMSTFLKIEIGRVGHEKGHISNVRGYGTFLGFDVASEESGKLM
jgi:4-aminobutyrate aminotransferase/(S)-3-amino-2-methylpropionate transaminase